MKQFATTDGAVWLNDSDRHWFGGASPTGQKKFRQALDRLKNYGITQNSLSPALVGDIDQLIDEGVCLTPSFFLGRKPINWRIAERCVYDTDLGSSLIATLSEVGLMGFIERQRGEEQRDYSRRLLLRLLASLVMATSGADHVDDLPKELLVEWLSYWRTPDGLRWRTDVYGNNDRVFQCIREVAHAFSRHFDDSAFLDYSLQVRIGSGPKPTWRAIEAAPTPIQAALLRHYSTFAAQSRARPMLNKQMIMDLSSFFEAEAATSLDGALASPLPRRHIINFYLSRYEGASDKILNRLRQAKRFLEFVIQELRDGGIVAPLFPLITDDDIEWLKNELDDKVGKPSRARARPLPERLYYLARQILDEGENGWAGRQSLFRRNVFSEGEWSEVYCPVIPTLLRCAFDLPLRMAQWRRLDSGEGDLRKFNATKMTWEENTAPTSQYWRKRDRKSNPMARGYAHLFDDVQPPITGFFVNTNKTGAPYTIPWMSEELHLRLYQLLEWQQRYNKITKPVEPDQYLDQPNEYSAAAKKRLPDIFALFRTVPDQRQPFPGRPPTATEVILAWHLLMAEVEKLWNEANPDDPITIVERYNKHTGQPQKSLYTPHGMRVRGITNLHRAGIPIDVLSQMVAGHASIVMTLYYVEYDPATIHGLLQKAASETQSAAAREFINDLKNMRAEEARLRSTYTEHTSLSEAFGAADRVQFCNADIGVCPFDGTRCGDGGPIIRRDNRKNSPAKDVYGPVPGGPRNCIMCRHLISGPPFIVPLELYGTLLLSKRKRIASKQNEHRERLGSLRIKLREGQISAEVYRQAVDRLRIENNDLKDEIEVIDEAIFRVSLHLTAAGKILQSDEKAQHDTNGALVASDPNSFVSYLEVTEFEQASAITAASRVYTILYDSELDALKQRTLDQILFNAGVTPLSLRADITEEQRRKSADLLAQYFLTRLKRTDMQPLCEGRLRLQDLAIYEEVGRLIDRSLRNEIPLENYAPSQAALLAMVGAQDAY